MTKASVKKKHNENLDLESRKSLPLQIHETKTEENAT
jgi:hypothetical protein